MSQPPKIGDHQSTNNNTQDWKPEEVPQLTVDVYRMDDNIYIVSTIAGVNEEDLDISIDDNILSIKGIRRKPYRDEDVELLLSECFWGEFYRELTINEKIEIENIEAELNQGILVVKVPIQKLLNRKIPVNLTKAKKNSSTENPHSKLANIASSSNNSGSYLSANGTTK